MNPQPPDDSEVMREIFKLHPPTPRARGLARWAADRELQNKYPGQDVAYVDNWNGDELDRVVVAHAADLGEFHRLLAALDPGLRERVQTSHVPDPNGPIFIGGADFSSIGEAYGSGKVARTLELPDAPVAASRLPVPSIVGGAGRDG
jgi:hypothetical protein